jgi:hypothetical protein
MQVVMWIGGSGDPPATAGYYIGSSGFVANIADGVDIRGPAGGGGTGENIDGGHSDTEFGGTGGLDGGGI